MKKNVGASGELYFVWEKNQRNLRSMLVIVETEVHSWIKELGQYRYLNFKVVYKSLIN